MVLLFDFAGGSVYPPAKGQTPESIAVVAVGGYGRGTLAPGSDIDLLFVLPARQTPRIQSIVEFILYSLWDMRQKVGHATRSVDECIRLAKTDSTNLRLAYAADDLVFNWESDPTTLRVNGGPANGKDKKGAGAIPREHQ